MKEVRSVRLLVGSAFFLAPFLAIADSNDLLSVDAGISKTYIDNLFRQPSDGSGGGTASDAVTATHVKVLLRKSASLQRFEVAATLADNRYARFNSLNSRNNGFDATWQWQFTPRLTGIIASSRIQAQTDFADFRGTGLNVRTTETRRINADWNVFGGWTIGAGLSNTKQTNSQPFAEDASNEQDNVSAVIKYAWRSGTLLSYTRSQANGDFNRAPDPLTLSDSGFSDRRDDLRLDYPVTGKLRFSGYMGRFSRRNEHFAVRDFSGSNQGINFSYAATGTTSIGLSHSVSTDSWTDTTSSFTIRKTSGFSANWLLGSKLSLSASIDRGTRTFDGSALLTANFRRLDETSNESIMLAWAALRNLSISTAIQRSTRRSNRPGLNYTDRMTFVNASVSF